MRELFLILEIVIVVADVVMAIALWHMAYGPNGNGSKFKKRRKH